MIYNHNLYQDNFQRLIATGSALLMHLRFTVMWRDLQGFGDIVEVRRIFDHDNNSVN
jgi:hypothetical protein